MSMVVFRTLLCFFVMFETRVEAFSTPKHTSCLLQMALSSMESDDMQQAPDVAEQKTRRSILAGLLTASVANPSLAAPPIAVIAEELGYFPVTNREGDTTYVPKSVRRKSSDQAMRLAQKLKEKRVVMAGTYWCPHTSRQKELFGKEAWSQISYVECASKGYGADPRYCLKNQVEGYPTWIFPGGKQVSGERPLSVLAEEVGFKEFDETLETDIPGLLGSSACK